jgi:hypothetical protein
MRGDLADAVMPCSADKKYKEHVTNCEACSAVDRHLGGVRCEDGEGLVRAAERERIARDAVKK